MLSSWSLGIPLTHKMFDSGKGLKIFNFEYYIINRTCKSISYTILRSSNKKCKYNMNTFIVINNKLHVAIMDGHVYKNTVILN